MATKRKASRSKQGSLIKLVNRLRLTRLILFILTFSVIGVWYLISTYANNGYTVRFVHVCASNACSGSADELRSYASEIQNWYRGQTGRTFTINEVRSYRSPNPASYFGGGSYNTDLTHNRLYAELQSAGLIQYKVKTVVMLGFRSMSNCGVGGVNGELAIADPVYGCSGIKTAVLAHELGHNLGFPGSADQWHNTDGTLMHKPLACNGRSLSSCALSQAHKSHAFNSPWFAPAAPVIPTMTVQGYKVSGAGASLIADAALKQVQIVYQDNVGGSGRGNVPAAQGGGTETYFFRGIPQGWHRFNIANIPAGWEAIGYTLCYNRTDCHNGPLTSLLTHNGQPSAVINATGQGLADLWFHFRKITPQAASPAPSQTPSSATPAPAPAATNATFTNAMTVRTRLPGNRCWDVPAQQFKSGQTLQIWNCNNTIAQKWVGGTDSTLRTPNSAGLCMDVPGQRFVSGIRVQLYACNNTLAQFWIAYGDGSIRPKGNTNLCLDLSSAEQGTPLILYGCHGGTSQKWFVS